MFNHSSHISISRGIFNVFNGNQYNNSLNNSETDARFSPEEEWKVDLYQEYKRIPTGDCKLLRTICESTVKEYEYKVWQRKRIKGTRVFSVARLGRGRYEPCLTTVGYTGPDAKKLFEEDCMIFSRIKDANAVQLYAFNDSHNNPMIFFHDELVPMAHALQSHPDCRNALLQYIAFQDVRIFPEDLPPYASSWEQTWIRPQDGMIVYGPEGPPLDDFDTLQGYRNHALSFARRGDHAPPIPMNLYNHQTIGNYLSTWLSEGFTPPEPSYKYPNPSLLRSFRSNPGVLHVSSEPLHVIAELPEASGVWGLQGESDTVLMDDGRIRFLVNKPFFFPTLRYEINKLHETRIRSMWLAQALRLFKMHNIQRHDWENYGYSDRINLCLDTDGPFRSMSLLSDLYLFACPCSRSSDGFPDIQHWISGTNVWYWSTDPDGRSEMTEKERVARGLPGYSAEVDLSRTCTWSLYDYDSIRDIQMARGFDPVTTDFARSLEYPIFKVVYPQEGRFEEVADDNEFHSPAFNVRESKEDAMEVDSHSSCSYELPGGFSSSVRSEARVEFEDTDVEMEDYCILASQLGDEVEMEVEC